MVKAIGGHYYVYEYRSVTIGTGRKTKMGTCIGSIKEDIGFVPNDGRTRKGEITCLEFGQYAVALANTGDVLELLKAHFNPMDAVTVYAVAVINCVNGMMPVKDVGKHHAMGILALHFPSVKMGPDALASLLDALGRRQKGVLSFEGALCAASDAELAIDGHAMPSSSRLNDLAEPGYKHAKLGSGQVNLLMAFDVKSRTPVLSRFYEGAVLDKSSVCDLLTRTELTGKLFVVDSGFYSSANLTAFTDNGNSYIIPLQKNLNACKEAVADTEVDGRFIYRKNRKVSCVEYRECRKTPDARIVLYRDLNKVALEQSGYLAKLEQGAKGYTEEGFERTKDVMGVIVLQTSRFDMSAQEIYETYKRRWSIETFFDYLKNGAGFTSPGVQDYYKAQGLAFVMLVTALVHKGLEDACAKVKGKSVDDCLIEARMVKINKVGKRWISSNLLARQQDLFEILNTPLSIEKLQQHT
jgi:hypothetical protein